MFKYGLRLTMMCLGLVNYRLVKLIRRGVDPNKTSPNSVTTATPRTHTRTHNGIQLAVREIYDLERLKTDLNHIVVASIGAFAHVEQ